MGKGNASYRQVLKLASLIENLPSTDGKAYQQCDSDQKARMLMELAWKEMTGDTYTHQWYVENKRYL